VTPKGEIVTPIRLEPNRPMSKTAGDAI